MFNRVLKILIVDDETEIREGILNSISWEKHGFAVAGLADNGREALRIINEEKPDLMLLDIRMPVMNGLEVLEKLAEEGLSLKVIILSGYDDFNYCQQALRFGASDYLLKPCHPNKILEVLIKLKEQIATEEEQADQWDFLLQKFQENLPILRENLLMSLFSNKPLDNKSALVRWNLYQMGINPNNMGLALVKIDHQDKLASCSLKELELNKLSLFQQIEAAMKKNPALKSVINFFYDKIVILWNIEEETSDIFSLRMEQLRQIVANNMSFTITIGLGEPAANLTELHNALDSALFALEHGFWEGYNRIINYHEINEDNFNQNQDLVQEENLIVHCIRTNDPEKLESALQSFFANLTIPGKNSKEYLQKMITALICSVYHVCLERGINTDSFFGPNLAILDELPRIETLQELHERILLCFKQIIELHPLQKTQWKIVSQAVTYIEEHYAEDLNLENIANVVFVSPGYLSTIFKQVLQKNFVDYLTEVRIEKAKELLKNYHLKIYEISVLVGYKDEKYFSQIFKKGSGMTPNQYRDTIKDG